MNTTAYIRSFAILSTAATLAFGVACTTQKDDIESGIACKQFCKKSFECDEYNPTRNETRECVSDCRATIDNECGAENQAAVNEQIMECKDRSCGDFRVCMVFETGPECLGLSDD